MEAALRKLRSIDVISRIGPLKKESDAARMEEFQRTGVKFAIVSDAKPQLEDVYYQAVHKLLDCIVPNGEGKPILQEGGVYLGCWLESTGTINAELLSRFMPAVTHATYGQFADLQREDGLLPYKITSDGAVFKQIQLVTPPARSVWNHYLLNGPGEDYLKKMYITLSRYDEWLATYRNTRGTGCVEAFCTFDTGHDLSARFWHVPDTPHKNNPALFDPSNPVLPYLAPDLTASVYCSRKYLSRMAERLGDAAAAAEWERKAEMSLQSLMANCYDEADGFFYDVDRTGKFVRVQSDVYLRVLACEVGDESFFASALRSYLLNTRKFFAKYPFTSVAMDDPRFDPHSTYNTWSGATNFLSLIRAANAFEYHGHSVEFTWVMQPIISAMSRLMRFGQCLSPWTGEEGYTESYSPALLCVLDYIERLCGILPTPDGELWFTGLLPYAMDHGMKLADQTGYSRTVDGHTFELVNGEDAAEIYIDGRLACRFPSGIRIVTDRSGVMRSVVGMSIGAVEGVIEYLGQVYPIRLQGNEVAVFKNGRFILQSSPEVISITY